MSPRAGRAAAAALLAAGCLLLPAVPAAAVILPAHISTSFGASSIQTAGTTSLSFSVSNPNPGISALSNIGFSDSLPSGLRINIVGTNDCGGVLTVTTSSVSLSGASLGGGQLCVVSGFVVEGLTAGLKTNSVTVTSSAGTGNTATANLTVVAPPEVDAFFTNTSGGGSPTWVQLGNSVAVNIGVTNPNTVSSLTGVGLTAHLPNGLVIANPNGVVTGGGCGAGNITAVAGSRTITLSGVTLAAGPTDPNSVCAFFVAVTGVENGVQTASTGLVASTEGGYAPPASAAISVFGPGARVYWSTAQSNLGGTFGQLQFARLDGSVAALVDGANSGPQSGTAIDAAAGRIYWPDYAGSRIEWSALDDSARGELPVAGATISSPEGMAIDPAAGLLYWANVVGSKPISFAQLNGGGGGNLNVTGATPGTAMGPAIDLAAGRIYWAGTSANKISYANLDGSGGGGDLPTTGATISQPTGVAIDEAARRIYWTNPSANKISYANLDGSGGGDLDTTGATVSNPFGIAVDPATGTVYWANAVNGGSISYAVPGGARGTLPTPGVTVVDPSYPSLLYPPQPAGAPTVTGGAAPGAKLTCSTGTWAPDLLGAHLYRAPQSLSYQWRRDGADLIGANASTYTAQSTGTYSCRVTVANAAGSAVQVSAGHPIATLSAVTISSPTTFVQLSTGIVLSYSATDSAGAAAVTYDTQYKKAHWNGDFGAWAPLGTGTPSTSKTVNGAPGNEYCLRVRAHDAAGNTSPWVSRCVVIPLDDRALSILSGDWTRATSAGTYQGTLTTTTAQGAKLRLVGARVDRVALVVTECPTCGKVGIYLGGAPWTTVNTYASTTRKQVILLPARFTLTTTTIALRAMSAGRRVLVDGLGIACS